MEEIKKLNIPPIDGECLVIRKLCERYDKIRIKGLTANCDIRLEDFIKTNNQIVDSIKKRIRYLNELIKD